MADGALRRREDLRPYQVEAAEVIVQQPRSMLHIEQGLGKTATSLTAFVDLFNRILITGVLVVAPRRVAETVWHIEARRWSHTAHLKVCVLRGAKKSTLARNLLRPFHIWVINYEALPWLFQQINTQFLRQGRYPPFNLIVFDEITRVKNPLGARINPWYARSNGVCMLDYFPRRVGLTGTPAPNGYIDLFGQYFAIDGGERLGGDITDYKRNYFYEDPYKRKLSLKDGAKERIEQRVADITVTMSADDYLQLPPYLFNNLWVDLPPKARVQYDEFERAMFAEFDADSLQAFNAAALTAKCRQIANGIVRHHEDRERLLPVHDAKLEALDEVLEEASGQPVLLSYIFRPDVERILARYRNRMTVEYLGPGVNDRQALEIVNAWNRREIELLCTHAQSAGHGLNLQHGGNIVVWFGLDYSLEGWEQLNARLRRSGQQAARVIIHRILARNTVDENVLENIETKAVDQDGFKASMKRYYQRRLAEGL